MGDEPGSDVRPPAIPISTSVRVPEGRTFDAVRETLGVIDTIHGDGRLPELPVGAATGSVEVGTYRWDDRTGQPRLLTVSRRSPHTHLTVAHEIGHFLDHQALGRPGEFASRSGRVSGLLDAIGATSAVGVLGELRRRRSVMVRLPTGQRWRVEVDRKRVTYVLRPEELFARAYAQYIVLRGQHLAMLHQLDRLRSAVLSGLVYHEQWTDPDFRPVAEAFDRLLRSKGWTR